MVYRIEERDQGARSCDRSSAITEIHPKSSDGSGHFHPSHARKCPASQDQIALRFRTGLPLDYEFGPILPVGGLAESTPAKTCQLSLPDTTWQWISMGRREEWRIGGLADWRNRLSGFGSISPKPGRHSPIARKASKSSEKRVDSSNRNAAVCLPPTMSKCRIFATLIPANCGCRPLAHKGRTQPSSNARSLGSVGRQPGCPRPGSTRLRTGYSWCYNGVTRATRIAKLAPGSLIRVEVVGKLRRACAGYPKIGDVLP